MNVLERNRAAADNVKPALVAATMCLIPDTPWEYQIRVFVIAQMWYVRGRFLSLPLVRRLWQAVVWRKVDMANQFAGTATSIDLPCPTLMEVARSVAVEDHHLDAFWSEAEYDSGRTIRLDVDVFEKYLGDEKHADVPIVKYSAKGHAPALCGNLRLRTPNYYRTLEIVSPGLRDPLEGCRASHEWPIGSQLMMNALGEGTSIVLDASGANRTDGCFKTFMYCCSLHENNRVLTRGIAKDIFGQDYTCGSVFPSSRELAKHIIVAFVENDWSVNAGKCRAYRSQLVCEGSCVDSSWSRKILGGREPKVPYHRVPLHETG